MRREMDFGKVMIKTTGACGFGLVLIFVVCIFVLWLVSNMAAYKFDEKYDDPRRFRYRSPIRLHRRSRIKVLIACLLAALIFYDWILPHTAFRNSVVADSPKTSDTSSSVSPPEVEDPKCPSSPLTSDILVVVRTGASEALSKLPVHFDTTLRCVPNYVIFSDYEEDIQGHHVFDVLDGVSETLKVSAPEFELYEQMKRQGRKGLSTTEHLGSGPAGSDNPSWKLDKFKFLPMVDKAARYSPDSKWFVFIEADTYLMWPNLVEYLSKLDASQNWYMGNPMWIGDVLFAHGGSGFVISQPAMNKVAQHWRSFVAEYDQYTVENWAGDMVLGKALKDVEVELTHLAPHFQGDPVSSFPHSGLRNGHPTWCYAPITYHHMRKGEIQKLWAFEKAWRRQGNGLLSHGNIFREYLAPKFATEVDDWDNISIDTDPISSESLGECHSACQAKPDCLQYSYMPGNCSTTSEVRYGNAANEACIDYSVAAGKCVGWREASKPGDTVQSGWMIERIAEYMKEKDNSCHGAEGEMWLIETKKGT